MVLSLTCFGIRWWRLHSMSLGVFPPLQSFESLRRIGIVLLWMFDRIPQWSHPILDFHLLGIFKLHILFYFYWSVYSNYLLLNSILAGCLFLETCLFLLGCLFWHIILHIFFWYLVFLWYQSLFLRFSFLFCLFGSSLFSSW